MIELNDDHSDTVQGCKLYALGLMQLLGFLVSCFKARDLRAFSCLLCGLRRSPFID